ncbi:hypothetical protein HK101_001261 [Irineochytrium annulatum]|nr:hypothetical protein HK101_001261 [Irineochytrium annulatum]
MVDNAGDGGAVKMDVTGAVVMEPQEEHDEHVEIESVSSGCDGREETEESRSIVELGRCSSSSGHARILRPAVMLAKASTTSGARGGERDAREDECAEAVACVGVASVSSSSPAAAARRCGLRSRSSLNEPLRAACEAWGGGEWSMTAGDWEVQSRMRD